MIELMMMYLDQSALQRTKNVDTSFGTAFITAFGTICSTAYSFVHRHVHQLGQLSYVTLSQPSY